MMAATIIGKREPHLAVIFEIQEVGNLESAIVLYSIGESWGLPIPLVEDARYKGSNLASCVQAHIVELIGVESARSEGGVKWNLLVRLFGAAYNGRELVRIDWVGETSLIMFGNRDAGFILVQKAEHRRSVLDAVNDGIKGGG
jgi:hypothetical protein